MIDNIHDIMYGDVFHLKYFGINVFFAVCKTDEKKVAVYELSKKKIKQDGKTIEIICSREPTSSPLVVPKKENCDSKSNTWFETTEDKELLVKVTYNCPLFQKIENPRTGIFKATLLEEEMKHGILNYYWTVDNTYLKKKPRGKKEKSTNFVC